MSYNCIFIVGPTAAGKTAIGVRLAKELNGEIISADSRQVYKGLDIGSGKDLKEYDFDGSHIPYHLIDICDLKREYNLFDFQEDFYKAFSDISLRKKLPFCVGGTGMYVDNIIRNYAMIPFKENPDERAELEKKTEAELKEILTKEKEKLHNTSDFTDKARMIKAILINRFNLSGECQKKREKMLLSRPKIEPLVLGTTLERACLREKIAKRLKERLDSGLIEEVLNLHNKKDENGAEWQRLESLGLEYRFVSEYLQGKIESKEKLFELLNIAIGQFAKRQETWFRGMEKKGVRIHWLLQTQSVDERVKSALKIIQDENSNL